MANFSPLGQKSLLDLGHTKIGAVKNQKALGKGEAMIININRGYMAVAGEGGFLSRVVAQAAVGHIQSHIRSGGRNLPNYQGRRHRLNPEYEKIKAQYGGIVGGDSHVLSGTLYHSIKVLNRRLSGGGRYNVVGIDSRQMVPRIERRGGIGDMVSVAAYAHDIELGWSNDKPRPLIIMSMADFVQTVGQGYGSAAVNALESFAYKQRSRMTKDINSGAGAIPTASTNFSSGEANAIYVESRQAGLQTREVTTKELNNEADKEFIANARRHGMMEHEIQDLLREIRKL